jgi:regulatory protein
VLRHLSAAPKSRLQLARKLAERRVPEEVAEAVLDRFEEVQLINDAEFAKMWVRSRAQTRSLARTAIRRELADKGITGDPANEALAQRSDEDEEAAAAALVARKLRAGLDLRDRAERDKHVRRLVALLARKGYAPSTSFRVVNREIDRISSDM